MKWNRSFNSCLLPIFYINWLIFLSIWIVETSPNAKYNDWFQLEVKHLVLQPNNQENPNYEIKIFLPNMPCSQLNHMIDWLVKAMLWFSNVKPETYAGISTSLCSKKLHIQSYLEMLCSETGYFGLLGNKHILFNILLYLIER